MPLNDETHRQNYEIQLSVPAQREEVMRLCREYRDQEYDPFVKGRMVERRDAALRKREPHYAGYTRTILKHVLSTTRRNFGVSSLLAVTAM